MFATARHATALTLVAALFVGSASPALATDRAEDAAGPAGNLTLTVPTLLPATVSAIAPSIFSEAVQRPPIDMAGPREERTSGLAALRRSMYVSFAALQIMDAVSTRQALNNGAREANPALGAVAKNSAAMFAVKAGTAAATTFFAEKLAKKHPRRAAIVMAVLNVGYAAVVMHNYRVARNQSN
jgi:hypothetical protein